MKRGTLSQLALFGLIWFFFISSSAHALSNTKSVLILNSYHEGYTWTREEAKGAVEALLNSSLDIQVYVEYMDWKNYPTIENINQLFSYYLYKYGNKKLDVILTTDDMALQFAIDNRAALFSDAPVVFTGVNEDGAGTILKAVTNCTGILQPVLPEDALQLAMQTDPDLKTIYLVYDTTESGQSTARLAVKSIHAINEEIEIIHLTRLSYPQLLKRIGAAENNSIIYILSHYMDFEGNAMEFDDFSEKASAVSPVPVFHMYDFTVGRGAVGGSMLSGRLQGEMASKLALRVLEGEDINSIPIQDGKNTIRRIYDYHKLSQYKIPLDRISSDSEIINRPFSFVHTYWREVLLAAAVFSALITLISMLIYHIHRQKQTEKKLTENKEELTQLNEELIATEEELIEQNEQLSISRNRLQELAYQDYLTNLPNRLALTEKLESLISSQENTSLALFFIDTDNFKYINDSMGHSAGDELLVLIGKRIQNILAGEGTLFRFGGDEFVVVLKNLSKERVTEQATGLIQAFREPFEVNFSTLHISISIGISMYPESGVLAEDLIKSGDIAMYHAKAQGKGRYIDFSENMNYNLRERIAIENHLRTALQGNEFLLCYQPQIDIATGTISGFEALVRWISPQLGHILPNTFIPVAEETQLILPLGEWVLKEACLFGKKLGQTGGSTYTVSVNISILQLLQADFVDTVLRILQQTQFDAKLLELEITESILMESYDLIDAKIHQLRRHGVRFALDDFGKGYSSLTYLKNLPINTLKIDKLFISENTPDEHDASITGSIITMGLKLGLTVIAEGVETPEQLDYLAKHNCSKYQGYLFSEPLSTGDALILANQSQAVG